VTRIAAGLMLSALAALLWLPAACPDEAPGPDDSLEQALDKMLDRFIEGVRGEGEAPTEIVASGTADPGALRLRPGLMINVLVTVAGEREFEDLDKRINNEGNVALTLLGNVHVSGMTLSELSKDLEEKYQTYIRQPHVEVTFSYDEEEEGRGTTSPWGSVTVMGRVKKSGRVNIPPTQDLTLSRAVQEAGGFDTSAKVKGIRVTRKRDDGSVEKLRVDLQAVAVKGEEDLKLKDGDVIYVPERLF
jgi:protein involved in polysaccharide export with SLBB domain